MTAWQATRDALKDSSMPQDSLDAVQLVKHAFGLVTEAARRVPPKKVALVYLYAEPKAWPDGKPIALAAKAAHAAAVDDFQSRVTGDAVEFLSLTYDQLLNSWEQGADEGLRIHAAAVRDRFLPT
jgi:hypothetical protein